MSKNKANEQIIKLQKSLLSDEFQTQNTIKKLLVLPDKGFETSTGNSFWDVGEELQAELTQKVILPLQGQEHKVRTNTVEGHDGKSSHLTEITLTDLINSLPV